MANSDERDPTSRECLAISEFASAYSSPSESEESVASRVIYRTKEDVRGWDDEPLFPLRHVNPALVIPMNKDYQSWLTEIHSLVRLPWTWPASECSISRFKACSL